MNARLRVDKDILSRFYHIIEKGFTVDATVGCTVRDLLCRQFGIDENYVSERIQTIFIDGKTIDDIDTAIVMEGASLAMSAAMPGLIGATLRKGSYYAAMRGEISYQTNDIPPTMKKGRVVIKLFNMLARELGDMFLARGVWIPHTDLAGLFEYEDEGFRTGCREVVMNGEQCSLDRLLKMGGSSRQIFLQVESM